MRNTPIIGKYINPYSDFGFKRLFGIEASKDLLIDFLNSVFELPFPIVSVTIQNNEQTPETLDMRKAFFDIYCTDSMKNEFIIEMQKAGMNNFKDRALLYVSLPFRVQAERGDWDFALQPIYFLGILDFYYDKTHKTAKFCRTVELKDQDGEVFYDKLQLMFLQMPCFKKTEQQLETRLDYWCYFLKNIENLSDVPTIFKNDATFMKAMQTAEVARLSKDERFAYEISRLQQFELKAVVDTAFENGEQAASDRLISEIEEHRHRAEEADHRAEEERHRAEEADRRAEEADRRAEALTLELLELRKLLDKKD